MTNFLVFGLEIPGRKIDIYFLDFKYSVYPGYV
jgi:hypothetical protein